MVWVPPVSRFGEYSYYHRTKELQWERVISIIKGSLIPFITESNTISIKFVIFPIITLILVDAWKVIEIVETLENLQGGGVSMQHL